MSRTFDSLYRLAERVEAGKPSPMMVFPVGDWTSAKYPKLSLTQELADEIIANFEADVLRTRVPIDANHDPKSPANGWVERLYMAPFEWNGLSGDALYADWTPNERGAQAVNGGEYAYDSLEIGSHTDPVSGFKHDNVLRAISLTNRPVLRMLPPVADAAESIRLAEPVEMALCEVTATEIPTTEDDGNPAESHPASSDGSSQPAKADEGQPVALAEGDAAAKGVDPRMKSVIQKLQLSEDADESAVLAAVVTLSEERDSEKSRADAAEAKLAESEKAKRDAAVEAQLAELIDGGHLLPGQKAEMLALAEDSASGFDRAVAVLKTSKAIVLGESGSAEEGETAGSDIAVELAEKSAARAAKDGIDEASALSLVLSENPTLKDRYLSYTLGGREL